MALSCTVFDTFDFEECHNLEIQVRGHSRSSKLVSFNSLPMVYYQHPITTLCLKCTIYWDICLWKVLWPWNPGYWSLTVS